MKNDRNEWNYVFLAKAFVLIIGMMALVLGRKEKHLYQEFEEGILREQKERSISEVEIVNEGEKVQSQSKERKEETAAISLEIPSAIRVLLTDNTQSGYVHEDVVLFSSGGIQITGDLEQEFPPGEEINIKDILTTGCIRVQGKEKEGTITVSSLEKNEGLPAYEGVLEILCVPGGFRLINEVDLETYLKYVVPSEMPSGYPLEALKAQAVCARTYAVSQIREGRLQDYGADVDDTVSFQVYHNISRQESTDQAVEDTRGQIMCWQGEPVQAYFFSTSCGYTSTDEVWDIQETAPYLKSVSVSSKTVEAVASGQGSGRNTGFTEEAFRQFICGIQEDDFEKEESWYRWQITFPIEKLQSECRERFPQIGKLKGFQVIKRSGGGGVRELVLTGEDGKESICNEYDIREFFSPKDIPIRCVDGKERGNMKILPSSYFVIDEVYEEEQLTGFTITGGGYGHGVGMSQNGAKYLGETGRSWKEILQLFYKDITIEGIKE